MKHVKLFTLIALAVLLNANLSFTQDMRPPAPVQNEFFDAMVGNSSGESVMNGKTYDQNVSIQWDLNHQFLKIYLTGVNKSNPQDKYEGLGIYGIDAKGNVKTWWFDVWGAGSVSTGTGTISGDKMITTEEGPYYRSNNTFEFRDNAMYINRQGSLKTPDGKEISFDETLNFKKNK